MFGNSSSSQHQTPNTVSSTPVQSQSQASKLSHSNNLSPKSSKRSTTLPNPKLNNPITSTPIVEQVVPIGSDSSPFDLEKNEKLSRAFEFLKDDAINKSQKMSHKAELEAMSNTNSNGTSPASSILSKEEGRLQAYGWSLPSKKGESTSTTFNLTVPVPVFCRPLFSQDNNLKLSCSMPVRYQFDKSITKDCDELIEAGPFSHFRGKNNSQIINVGPVDEYKSSCVWICNFDENDTHISIFDANKPSDLISQFTLKGLKIHCSLGVGGKNSFFIFF